jgi:hypothetical protein
MKLRLTESKLRKMIEETIMESIQEGCLDEYFFGNTDEKKQKSKESCPVVDRACYQVSKKKKPECPATKKACYQVSKKEKEQMNEWLGFPGMDEKDIEKAVKGPEKDKKSTDKKPNKSKKTTKKALNEFMAGGNDWGRTYDDYRVNNQTNMELDEIVRDLHTICQYFDDLYSVANENQRSKYFPKMQPQLAEYVVELISPIYSLFANRTNRKGDRQGMSVEEIKNTCFDSLKQLSNPAYRSDLGVINSAAARALNALRTYTPAQPTQQNK